MRFCVCVVFDGRLLSLVFVRCIFDILRRQNDRNVVRITHEQPADERSRGSNG